MSDSSNQKSLGERLQETLDRKRAEAQVKKDAEYAARAQAVRTLQGMLGPVPLTRHTCSQCGHTEMVFDPRPVAPDDDYDSRL